MRATKIKVGKNGRVLYDYPDLGTEAKGAPRPRDKVRQAKQKAAKLREGNKAMDNEAKGKKMTPEELKEAAKKKKEELAKSLPNARDLILKGGGGEVPNAGATVEGSNRTEKKKKKNPQYDPESGNVDMGNMETSRPHAGERADGTNQTLPGVYGKGTTAPDSANPNPGKLMPAEGPFSKSMADAYGDQLGQWADFEDDIEVPTEFGTQLVKGQVLVGSNMGRATIQTPNGPKEISVLLDPNKAFKSMLPEPGSVNGTDSAPLTEAQQSLYKSMGTPMEAESLERGVESCDDKDKKKKDEKKDGKDGEDSSKPPFLNKSVEEVAQPLHRGDYYGGAANLAKSQMAAEAMAAHQRGEELSEYQRNLISLYGPQVQQ